MHSLFCMASPPGPGAASYGAQIHVDRGVYGLRASRRGARSAPAIAPLDATPTPTSDVASFVRRVKVVHKAVFGELTLHELENISAVHGAPVLEASPAVGHVSMLAAKYLVDTMALPLCGFVSSPAFPPGCAISLGQPSTPLRIFGDARLVVVRSELRLPIQYQQQLIAAIADFCTRHASSMIFVMEGKPDNTLVTGSSQHVEIISKLVPAPRAGSIIAPFVGHDDGAESVASSPERGGLKHGRSRSSTHTRESESSDDDFEALDAQTKAAIHYVTTCPSAAALLAGELGALPMLEGAIDGMVGGLVSLAPTLDTPLTALLVRASALLPDARAAATAVALLTRFVPSIPSGARDVLEDEANVLEAKLAACAAAAPPPPSTYGMYM